ncbi:hypothetical protein [Streptomyces sp. NPDC003863]
MEHPHAPHPCHALAPAATTALAPVAIRAEGLRKVHPRAQGGLVSVDGMDLTVHQGEFSGLLGTNGAGKAWAAGHEVSTDPVAVKSRIGVVSQADTLDRALTVADDLAFHGRYFGMPAPAARRRALELLDRFGLRASLAPSTGHMPTWACLAALTLGAAALLRFARRVRT